MGSAMQPQAVHQLHNSSAAILSHLPRSEVLEYSKHQVIYSRAVPPIGLYLVLDGRVKLVHRNSAINSRLVTEMYFVDDLFGETAFLNISETGDEAIALEKTTLMAWTVPEVETLAVKGNKLGLELVRYMAGRVFDLEDRIRSFALDNCQKRLARTLIHLSERLGVPADDGTVLMSSFTHELLAQYIGTTREIVTTDMNYLRMKGLISYSRSAIAIRRTDLLEWIGRA